MVFNFLFYTYLFIRCFKYEVSLKNLPCREKLSRLKVMKVLFANENFYRLSFFLMTIIFYQRIFFGDKLAGIFLSKNFETVSLCNYFSCRSKASGSLTLKSDYQFIVAGIQLIQYKDCISYATLKFSSLTFLVIMFLRLRYFNDFDKQFL